jgi:hypothetical protein
MASAHTRVWMDGRKDGRMHEWIERGRGRGDSRGRGVGFRRSRSRSRSRSPAPLARPRHHVPFTSTRALVRSRALALRRSPLPALVPGCVLPPLSWY